MQEFVFGDPGSGKTSYVVAKVKDQELLFFNPRYKACCNYLASREKSYDVKYSRPPQRHTLFANFDIARKFPYMKNYDISGYEFGVPNEFCPTKALLPFGTYVFDEAQRYWPSSEQPPPWVVRAFQLRRHIYLNAYLIAQRFTDLHAKVRDISDVYTKIIRSEHTYLVGKRKKKIKSPDFLPYGKLISTTWYGRQFFSSREAEHWNENADSEKGKAFEYTTYGDIRKYYNSHNYAVNFENVNQDYEFTCRGVYAEERPREWDEYRKKLQKEKKKEAMSNATG